LTTKLSSSTGGVVSKVQQRQETIEIAFPKGIGLFRESAEQERPRPPGVKFWNRSDFNETDIGNENTRIPQRLRFLEQEDGLLIPPSRLDNMRAYLLAAFSEIKTLMPELLGNGWLKCDTELHRACYAEMRHVYPELTLCANNWKVRSLLIEWYGNWHRPRLAIKEEEMDDGVEGSMMPMKRRKRQGPGKSKKLKMDSNNAADAQIPPIVNPLFVILPESLNC
jgi:hypothetical protein